MVLHSFAIVYCTQSFALAPKATKEEPEKEAEPEQTETKPPVIPPALSFESAFKGEGEDLLLDKHVRIHEKALSVIILILTFISRRRKILRVKKRVRRRNPKSLAKKISLKRLNWEASI